MIRSTPQKRPKNQKRKNTENRFFTPDRLGKPILRTGLKNQNFDCIALDNTPMHFLHTRPIYSHVYIFCRPEKEKTKNGKTRKTKSSHRISSENRFFAPDWHRLKNQKSINNLSNHRPFSKRVCIVDLDHNKAWKRRNQKKRFFKTNQKKLVDKKKVV